MPETMGTQQLREVTHIENVQQKNAQEAVRDLSQLVFSRCNYLVQYKQSTPNQAPYEIHIHVWNECMVKS